MAKKTDVKRNGKNGQPVMVYELTKDEKSQFLGSLATSCKESTELSLELGWNIRTIQWNAEEDAQFSRDWSTVINSINRTGIKDKRAFNAMVAKGTMTQKLVDAGVNDMFVELLGAIDTSTKEGRSEGLKFMSIYASMMPKETAADVRMHKPEKEDHEDKSVEELQAIFYEVQQKVQTAMAKRIDSAKNMKQTVTDAEFETKGVIDRSDSATPRPT